MKSTPPRKSIAPLLAASVVYLLGAPPCGCLDHNGWCQTVRVVAGDHAGHGHGHEPLSADSHDCDHAGSLDAVVSPRAEFAGGALEVDWATVPMAESALGVGPCGRPSRDALSQTGEAPPLRAVLQVFLI